MLFTLAIFFFFSACSEDKGFTEPVNPEISIDENFDLVSTQAIYNPDLEQIVMSIEVKGQAGASLPNPKGQLDGAPVPGYVFPTTLTAKSVGFGDAQGIVAMALTSHPDFDDTPLWDENNDRDYGNDGIVWHAHWVLLTEDNRVEGGLSVKQFDLTDETVILPPTNPGMPMYMDSPGYQVLTKGNQIRVVIPTAFTNNQSSFNFDAVAVYMQVNTSNPDLPMLGIYEVFDILSGDLSLPFSVQ